MNELMLFSFVTSHFLQINLLLFNSKSSKFKSTKMIFFGSSNKNLFASARPVSYTHLTLPTKA